MHHVHHFMHSNLSEMRSFKKYIFSIIYIPTCIAYVASYITLKSKLEVSKKIQSPICIPTCIYRFPTETRYFIQKLSRQNGKFKKNPIIHMHSHASLHVYLSYQNMKFHQKQNYLHSHMQTFLLKQEVSKKSNYPFVFPCITSFIAFLLKRKFHEKNTILSIIITPIYMHSIPAKMGSFIQK